MHKQPSHRLEYTSECYYHRTAAMCFTGKSETSRDTAQQLSLLADTYSLTCDIMMHDAAAVTADTDTVTVLTDIAGCSKTYSHNQVTNIDTHLLVLSC